MPELLQTLDAIRENQHQLLRAVLLAQGIDIDEDDDAEKPKTAEDVYNETMNEIYGFDVELDAVGITFSDQL